MRVKCPIELGTFACTRAKTVEMEELSCKNAAMASDVVEIREATAVGRRLLERYGNEWWEAQVVRKVDTGIDIEFTKKNRGRTWEAFIEWSELAEDADLPEAEQTYIVSQPVSR